MIQTSNNFIRSTIIAGVGIFLTAPFYVFADIPTPFTRAVSYVKFSGIDLLLILLIIFIVPLVLTVLFETLAGSVFLKVTKQSSIMRPVLRVIFGANLVTNPILNLLVFVTALIGKFSPQFSILVLEIIVVIVEWRILVRVFGKGIRFPFLLSLIINIFSLVTGVLVFLFLGLL